MYKYVKVRKISINGNNNQEETSTFIIIKQFINQVFMLQFMYQKSNLQLP